MPSPWDRLLAGRVISVTAALLVLAAAVAAATDEASATWGSRAARLCVLTPLLGGAGAIIVSEQARRRGELRAISVSGGSPWNGTRGVVFGAALPAALGALLLALRVGPVDGLFPVLPASPFRAQGHAFVAPAAGIRIEDGAVTFLPRTAEAAASHTDPRAVLVLLVLVAAFAVPAWSVAPMSTWRRVVVGAAASLSGIVAFHAVGAGASPLWVLAPPFVLGADMIFTAASETLFSGATAPLR